MPALSRRKDDRELGPVTALARSNVACNYLGNDWKGNETETQLRVDCFFLLVRDCH